MTPIRSDLTTPAPRHLVWGVLADLEGVSTWNPGIDSAECVSEIRNGLGARRRCYMHPSGWMVESVSEWEPETVIAFTIEDAPPLKSGLGRFVLADTASGTRLTASFDYEVRFGPLGPVIDRLIVHRQLSAAWDEGMAGLITHLDQLGNCGTQNDNKQL
ncbi:MAG: SRPBCC family protein [Acidimicrobiales bacterium]